MIRQIVFLWLLFLSSAQVIAGPRVDIVIGEKAPALERLAADELAGQLKRVYEAEVQIAVTVPADAPHVIFVGSPDTNASMKLFADSWPSGDKKLTDQGHLLRSVTHNNKPALLVGGGSPVATYWAVAEFGHRLGIRSMLFGDLDPVSAAEFSLRDVDVVIEPSPRHRGFHFSNGDYVDSGCWSTDEFRFVFRQLAKLRFNHVTITIETWQPYVHFEFDGIERTSSSLVGKGPIAVSGDTLGRKAFGGAKLFENPSFVGADTYARRRAAAETQLREIMSAAHEIGLRVTLEVPVQRFPAEFARLLPDVLTKFRRNSHDFWPRLNDLATDDKLAGLLKAWVRAIIESYPTLDGLQIDNSIRDKKEAVALRQFFLRPGILKQGDRPEIPVTIYDVPDDENAVVAGFAGNAVHEKRILRFMTKTHLLVTLPYFHPLSWEKQWDRAVQLGGGFDVAMYSGIGEHDLPVYWLSRRGCRQLLSPQQACHELLDPICGEGVDHRVWKAVELIESAAMALPVPPARDSGVGNPEVQYIWRQIDPPPTASNEARDAFLNAMNEMYRANTRAREGGRAFTLYLARRFEFAFEYMNYAEAVRNSAIAERAKDRDTQIAEIEKAIESLNNALNAMAAVARSNSDRGLIAVLNEYGYRPLKKKLAEAEEAK